MARTPPARSTRLLALAIALALAVGLTWLVRRSRVAPSRHPSNRFGPPRVVATFAEELGHGIATDEDAVYLTASVKDAGFVYRVDKRTGKPQLLAREPRQAVAVRVDGDWVYYSLVAGAVRRVGRRGGQPSTVSAAGNVWSMAQRPGTLFLADRMGALDRLDLAGGTKRRLCDVPGMQNVMVDDGVVLFKVYTGGLPSVWRLTPDGRCLTVFHGEGATPLGRSGSATLLAYEPFHGDDYLFRFPDDGGPPVRLAHIGFTQERAVDADAVYIARTPYGWAPGETWEIVRIDKHTGAVAMLAKAPRTSVEEMSVDASGVYWVGKALDGDGWRLVEIPRSPAGG